jgi:hypothetical protein
MLFSSPLLVGNFSKKRTAHLEVESSPKSGIEGEEITVARTPRACSYRSVSRSWELRCGTLRDPRTAGLGSVPCLALVHVELTVDALDVGVVTKAHHVVGVTRDPSGILLRSSFVRAAVWPLLVIPGPPTTPGWTLAIYAL